MSGLREAFDELVADVPVYGDLDRAIERADRERRRQRGLLAGLAAAAAVVAVVVGVLAVTRSEGGSKEPVGPTTPTPGRTQGAHTWADTAVTVRDGYGWEVANPLIAHQQAWFPVVAGHLDPGGRQLRAQGAGPGLSFRWTGEASSYPSDGRVELLTVRGPLDDGCHYLTTPPASNGTESCTEQRLAGPDGERVRVARYQRLCGAFDGPASAYATCGDFKVAVAVDRRDGLVGYLVVTGRGTPDRNPVGVEAMIAAAADSRLTLPEAALSVPSYDALASIVTGHLPRWRLTPRTEPLIDPPGAAFVGGRLDRHGLTVQVWAAGADPVCGRSWLVQCVERRVYGADDPTTVFVGAWDEEDWADCCPRDSRAYSRQLVYVGPRHTVVVHLMRVVRQDEPGIGPELDQPVIDLLLDPRLQAGSDGRS